MLKGEVGKNGPCTFGLPPSIPELLLVYQIDIIQFTFLEVTRYPDVS